MKQKTLALVEALKHNDCDFEFYPTTQEIIDVVKRDIEASWAHERPSILDCGAGDGRVLTALDGKRSFAIEKAEPLINALDREVFVVGTDFKAQTLIDKKVDVVFSNPPYSEFADWSTKIIKEANASAIYLVVPERWEAIEKIHEAIKLREATHTVLGDYDFESADRQARAKVHVIKIDLSYKRRSSFGSPSAKTSPFDVWFDDNFKIGEVRESETLTSFKNLKERVENELEKSASNNELVKGDNIVPVLEALYQHDLELLIANYKSLEAIDGALMDEMGVKLDGLKEALSLKINGLKDRYWQELFNHLDKVTSKLCVASRQKMLKRLTEFAHVDFTQSNAYAIVIWVIKNANHFYNDQLIELVERMVSKANAVAYVSNRKTFGEEKWSWNGRPMRENKLRYKLEHRFVLEHIGGIKTGYDWEVERCQGLVESAHDLINDICTVASNLGYSTEDHQRPSDFFWESNKKYVFNCTNMRTSEDVVLMEVKAFKNGNLHFKINSDFMCQLNVEFGRLKGWVKSKQQAAEELDESIEVVEQHFSSALQLEPSSLKQLVKIAA